MKFKELQKKPAPELDKELDRTRFDLMKLRAQAAAGSAGKDAGKIRAFKRTIARILTIKQRTAAEERKKQ